MKRSIFIIFFLTFHLVNAQETDTKAYNMADCSILYPSSWNIDTSGTESTRLILYAPFKGEFGPNINLLVQEVGDNVSLNDFNELTVTEIKKVIDKCKIIESTTVNNANPPFIKLVYSGTYSKFQLQWMQYLWIYNSKCYILTFTALKKGYKKDIKEATFIFNSFRFN